MLKLLSIGDDDLCVTCRNCMYNPGSESKCKLDFPGKFNSEDQIVECESYENIKKQKQNLMYEHVIDSFESEHEANEVFHYLSKSVNYDDKWLISRGNKIIAVSNTRRLAFPTKDYLHKMITGILLVLRDRK